MFICLLSIEILGVLLAHDRTLTQRAYRAAIIAARLGKSSESISIQSMNFHFSQVMIDVWKHCLIMAWMRISWIVHEPHHCMSRMFTGDESLRIIPLYLCRVRSLKLSTARLLVSHGANQNLANNRGETAIGLAEYLQPDQKQSFMNVLIRK